MYFNKFRDLTEVLKVMKFIVYKQVYKRKRGVDGKIKTYKVRRVVEVYNKKPNLDFEETFQLVFLLKYIIIL